MRTAARRWAAAAAWRAAPASTALTLGRGGAGGEAGERARLLRDLLSHSRAPWETGLTPSEAAARLGAFWGVDLRPGDVVDAPRDALHALLRETSEGPGNFGLDAALFAHADGVTRRFFGDAVYLRGIVEFSNVCVNDCGYCGIRKHQPGIKRYTMTEDEIAEVALWAQAHGMGTLMLQSGELPTPDRLAFLLAVVRRVRADTAAADPAHAGLAVALSVGELAAADYAALVAAGASRYLLRIETSSPTLFAALHPPAQAWAVRVRALQAAAAAGLQVGTGVMVGLPGQTLADLAGDLVFFKDIGADMIGEAHGGTDKAAHSAAMVGLTTRMNALARVTLGNVNIAATTALQALDPVGRETALRRGANVLMPILTPTRYRAQYALYEGKPCITDTAAGCEACLSTRVAGVGRVLARGVAGDPPHAAHGRPAAGAVVRGGGWDDEGAGGVAGRSAGRPPAGANAATPGSRRQLSSSSPSLEARRLGHLWSSSPSPPNARPGHPSAPAAAPRRTPPLAPSLEHHRLLSTVKPPPGPWAGSDVPRTNVVFVGRMNSGKSTALCALAPGASIVDATPGTTADVKVALTELHAAGPVKLMDTAGVDEAGGLGQKKRQRALGALQEADVGVVVVDAMGVGGDLRAERELIDATRSAGATPLLLVNVKRHGGSAAVGGGAADAAALDTTAHEVRDALDPHHDLAALVLDLGAPGASTRLASAVEAVVAARGGPAHAVPCLPPRYLSPDATVLLNIPMDAETPSMRLLRPQALVQEEALRHYATTIAHRMDLAAARGDAGPGAQARERARWEAVLAPLVAAAGPAIVVTDSQAMDVVHPWTLDVDGQPRVDATTFSVCMANRQSGGQLAVFVDGLKAVETLPENARILVAEACNHNRITQACNDIGLVQVPAALHRLAPSAGGLRLDHAFGRDLPAVFGGSGSGGAAAGPSGQPPFDLAVHCGGCMVDAQKVRARLRAFAAARVPVTNYGLLLARAAGRDALDRAVRPFGLGLGAGAGAVDGEVGKRGVVAGSRA